MKIYSGIKMYRFKDDEEHPEVIRVLNVDDDKKIIKYRDSEGKQQKEKLTNLTEKYKVLAPDGIVSFNDVSMPYNGRDVIVALQPFPKSKDKLNQLNDNLPYAVCRQFVVDMFSMCANPESNIIGMSVSKDTCPSTVDYKLMVACNEINYTRMIAVYLDDTLDGILNLFNNKPFDDALDSMKERWGNAEGYCSTLKELLSSNHFMYDFRRCFNIKELPYEIPKECVDSEQLDIGNTEFIAHDLKVNITDTYLLKYSREIDINSFKRDHLIIASAFDNYESIYILGYDTTN